MTEWELFYTSMIRRLFHPFSSTFCQSLDPKTHMSSSSPLMEDPSNLKVNLRLYIQAEANLEIKS